MTDSQDSKHKQTPQDVAMLYSFASVPGAGPQGAKYSDFSASRRETRAQFRDRIQWRRAHARTKEQSLPRQADAWSEQTAGVAASIHAAGVMAAASTSPLDSGLPPPGPQAAGKPDISSKEWEPEQDREQREIKEPGSEPQPQWFQVASETAPEIDPKAASETAPVETSAHAGGSAAGAVREFEERVSRWFVLNSIFPPESRAPIPSATRRTGRGIENAISALAVFSFAGGVGKSSLVATLGRALAAYGERVLLTETGHFGLLPLYFGSREHKPGAVRIFSPPNGSPDLPVHVVSLEPVPPPQDIEQDPLLEELLRDGRGSNRILIDIPTSSKTTLRRLLPLAPTVLVPLLPDMNSVASLDRVRAAFAGQEDSGNRRIEPVYLLNRFDASFPLHLDVREILRRQLGDHLLPFVMRQSPAISEALAQGMTVMDYAPDSSAAEDYLHLAGWLRSTTVATAGVSGPRRWSEQ